MRYGIFSDIHSNLGALEAVLEEFKKESIDKYLCVGDVVGYATEPKECIKIVKEAAMITVAGNHDWAAVNLFSTDYFNPQAREAILWTRNNLDEKDGSYLASLKLVYTNEDLTLVHGTLDNPQDFNYLTDGHIAEETFRALETDVCFVGHTHVPGFFVKYKDDRIHYRQDNEIMIRAENRYIVNVGSVGQPRDGNPSCAYCIYDTKKKEIRIERLNYNSEATRNKIISAGLPRFLGDRLIIGK